MIPALPPRTSSRPSTLARRLSLAILCGAAFVVAGAPLARAQPPKAGDAPLDEADKLAAQAKDLIKQNKWADAEPILQKAWGLKQSYDIAANLGLAEMRSQKWAAAADHLTFARERFPSNGKPEHRAAIETNLTDVLTHVAEYRVSVNEDGARISVDGVVVGTAPLDRSIFLEPGEHTFRAELAALVSEPKVVTAEAGAHGLSVGLEVRAKDDMPPLPLPKNGEPKIPTPPPEDSTLAIALVTTGFLVGAAMIGTGVGLTVASDGLAADAESERLRIVAERGPAPCFGQYVGDATCQQIDSDLGQSDDFSKGAIASYAIGGAFLVGSAIGLVVHLATSGPKEAKPKVQVTPAVSSDGAFLGVRAAF